jgi:hypothetical protein
MKSKVDSASIQKKRISQIATKAERTYGLLLKQAPSSGTPIDYQKPAAKIDSPKPPTVDRITDKDFRAPAIRSFNRSVATPARPASSPSVSYAARVDTSSLFGGIKPTESDKPISANAHDLRRGSRDEVSYEKGFFGSIGRGDLVRSQFSSASETSVPAPRISEKPLEIGKMQQACLDFLKSASFDPSFDTLFLPSEGALLEVDKMLQADSKRISYQAIVSRHLAKPSLQNGSPAYQTLKGSQFNATSSHDGTLNSLMVGPDRVVPLRKIDSIAIGNRVVTVYLHSAFL